MVGVLIAHILVQVLIALPKMIVIGDQLCDVATCVWQLNADSLSAITWLSPGVLLIWPVICVVAEAG